MKGKFKETIFPTIIVCVLLFVLFACISKNQQAQKKSVMKEDYLDAHNCLTEDVLIDHGVEKVRYLCNAEGANDDNA